MWHCTTVTSGVLTRTGSTAQLLQYLPTPLQASGQLINDNSGLCLTATPALPAGACTNVWARPLSDGSTAFGMINNGGQAANITCDAACFAAAGITPASAPHGLALRDIIRQVDLPWLSSPYELVALGVEAGGGGAAFKVSPLGAQ